MEPFRKEKGLKDYIFREKAFTQCKHQTILHHPKKEK